jgi:hypothetical protein
MNTPGLLVPDAPLGEQVPPMPADAARHASMVGKPQPWAA